MANKELIEGLNEQLNREVTTFLRYMLQAASIKGAEHQAVREMYLEEVMDEVKHAQYLANQIVMLGGYPRLEPDLTSPSSDVRSMLDHDAEQEKQDVMNYKRLANLAEQEDLTSLKLSMEEQGADEDEHRQLMRRMLG